MGITPRRAPDSGRNVGRIDVPAHRSLTVEHASAVLTNPRRQFLDERVGREITPFRAGQASLLGQFYARPSVEKRRGSAAPVHAPAISARAIQALKVAAEHFRKQARPYWPNRRYSVAGPTPAAFATSSRVAALPRAANTLRPAQMSLSPVDSSADDQESIEDDQVPALDLGVNFLDTSDIYGAADIGLATNIRVSATTSS